MFLYWAIGYTIALIVALFLPYDWWQKAPSRQRDKLIGKLLGDVMDVSVRNVVLRVLFIFYFLFLFLMTLIWMPFFFGIAILGMVLLDIFHRLFRRPSEARKPLLGMALVTALIAIFLCGFLVSLRLIPITGYYLLGRPAGNFWEMMTVGKEWPVADTIIGICGIFGVASWLILDAIWRFRQARQVKNLATSTVRSAAIGLVELKGVVRPFQGITFTAPAVEVSWSMFDYFVPRQRIDRFMLEDGTGTVLVDARECRVRAGWISELAAIFGVHEIVLTKRLRREDFYDSVVKTLDYGDRIYLVGNATRDKATGNLVIGPAERKTWSETLWSTLFGSGKQRGGKDIHDVFFLTDGTEADAERHILKGFRTVLLLGLLWIIASIGLVWSAHLPSRQAPPPDSWRNASWRGPEPNPNPIVLDYTRNERLFRFEKYMKTVGRTSFNQIPALIEAIGYRDYRFYTPATSALLRMMPVAKEQARKALPVMISHLEPCAWNAQSLQTMIIAVSLFGPDAAPAVPKLINALQCQKTSTYVVSPDMIRLQAVRALEAIGPAAKDAVPALREALNDPSTRVRESAERALRRIIGGNEDAGN